MKILIDIGHPGHVHYFRNAARIFQQHGHEVLFTARDKDVIFKLLNAYNLPFISRGAGGKSFLGKLLYLFQGDLSVVRTALRFRPDIFLSFGSPYAAQASKVMRKPHIAFDDSEYANYEHAMYMPFTDTVATPKPFRKEMGSKQVRFEGCIELCHLAPTHFQPDNGVLHDLGLTENDKYVVMRFSSWEASHDFGKAGMNSFQKVELVKSLSRRARVFLTSEGPLPAELEPYRLRISPEQLHDLLAFASLYVGEGCTTANECALLGTPNILVNGLVAPEIRAGVHTWLQSFGLQELFETFEGVTEKAEELLNDGVKAAWQERRQQMLPYASDVTAFMVWLVETYPDSAKMLRHAPEYAEKFRLAMNPA